MIRLWSNLGIGQTRQKVILQELEDHSNGDKAFVIGASYIIEVCSKATELFASESSTIEQKRYLLDFVLSSITLKGEKLKLTLKEPFEAILLMSKTGSWLAKWFLFQTFEELDSIEDKEHAIKEIAKLLGDDVRDYGGRISY